MFAKAGVNKVRITGGEPTVRKDCVDIVRDIASVPGIDTVAMTTNALTLKRKLKPLHDAGLNALNISIDSLVPAKYDFIT